MKSFAKKSRSSCYPTWPLPFESSNSSDLPGWVFSSCDPKCGSPTRSTTSPNASVGSLSLAVLCRLSPSHQLAFRELSTLSWAICSPTARLSLASARAEIPFCFSASNRWRPIAKIWNERRRSLNTCSKLL